MTVAELIAELQSQDPAAEVRSCDHTGSLIFGRSDVDFIFDDVETQGLLLPEDKQKKVKVVVLDSRTCGL